MFSVVYMVSPGVSVSMPDACDVALYGCVSGILVPVVSVVYL